MRIDSHQHYWKIARGDYGWITPELPVLYRDFLPEHLEPHLARHGLDGTIVVQAAPTLAETEFILSLSEQTTSICGVVGWIDLAAPSYREQYAAFSKHPKFMGVRIMIQDMKNAGDLLEPPFMEAFHWMEEQGIAVDVLVTAEQLDVVVELLERVPRLHCVIDHIAKPQIAAGIMEPWQSLIAAIAAHSGVYCKLSGMVTEAEHHGWRTSDFMLYIRHVIECFGPERVMFGSDWPVCLLSASYAEVVDVLQQCLPEGYTEEEQERLFGRNAIDFYRLQDRLGRNGAEKA
ncbi:hydrolase [Paenibacillus albidus]|uniref:Hydrolase n=1 Tax=Paenibacillus albidus TaxID=2041023 RepID=A0A917BWU0_9BACL|nr:amidohydrolase family protein [Paenibacillus albidus]GGF61069.1 hydrolase [Paenibacillus albidus]